MAGADLLSDGDAPVPRPAASALLPWHEPAWATLTRDLTQLPHALLLHGRTGLGKRVFARRLAQALLCLAPAAGATPCGACKSCRLFAAGTHPDFAPTVPLTDSQVIAVDQIRALGEFVALKPHTAARKLALIEPAEAMNLNAANSLLKVLEEPPPGSFLLLVSHQPARLPATIRSRCTQVRFLAPPPALAGAWLAANSEAGGDADLLLELAGGAPLLARDYAQQGFVVQRSGFLDDLEALATGRRTPLEGAARWKGQGEPALAWLQAFVADLIRLASAGDAARVTNPDQRGRLQALASRIELNGLFVFLEAISESRNLLRSPLDETLLLEDLLIRWRDLAATMG